jgi:hypothetical protein
MIAAHVGAYPRRSLSAAALGFGHTGPLYCVCVYYCRTYDKAVCGGGRGTVKDMCYEVRRAEACVD